MTLAERLLAGEHRGCATWRDAAVRLGVDERHLRVVRATLAGKGTPVTLGGHRESDRNIGVPIKGAEVPNIPIDSVFANSEPSKWPSVAAFDAEPAQPPRTIADDIADRRRRQETDSLKSRLREALDQLEQCRFELGVATQVDAARHDVAPIERLEHTSGLREAAACALASDWHIEEHVDAASVNGVNEYNIDIARQRAGRFFSGFSYLTRYHQTHFAIRNGLLWLGGDLITGYLREENLEHNELSPVQAIAELHTWLAAGIRQYLDETQVEQLRVICNSGNHGRLTDKVRPSTREANSIEWLLYVGLAREFAHEPRVQFVLPKGSQTYVSIYDLVIRFTHGDETKFGGGVGGIMIPIRKAIAKWQTVRHAHVTAMGHYHQEYFLRDLLVNGSLIGYNNYGLSIAAPFEEPRQSFFLVDSRRGVSMPATIWVEDQRRAA